MYGPPGTGKTLLARACAAQTDATFLKLAGPQLVQMFIGDGAKLVRDCFALAKEKAPAIIFIDELDAVGTKRFDSEKSGDREVQRTMLELLNQLDGFASDDRIKVLAATNRVDVLDPALLRSGRLDRKIEFPLPNEEARAQILKIHSRKMKVDPGVNWGELARSTDEFGGAMLKAVCVEAGMIALRSGKNKIGHEHYVDAIAEVQAKKKDVSDRSTKNNTVFCLLIDALRRSTSMLNLMNVETRGTGIGIKVRQASVRAMSLRRLGRPKSIDKCNTIDGRRCIGWWAKVSTCDRMHGCLMSHSGGVACGRGFNKSLC
jgi:SpoVK/Ycf46/Vps4 family AAA+-type ATPase